MMREPTVVDSEVAGPSSAHFVHAIMQFAMAVRHRRRVFGMALLVSFLLGGLYYLVAKPMYSAKAGLLVRQVGNDVWSPTGTQRNLEQTVLPTYQNLLVSPRVIEGALRTLRPEDFIDLANIRQDKWVATVQDNLTVRALRGTNILEVSYLSQNPQTAVNMVNAVVNSYLEFMNTTYASTAKEIVDVLKSEQAQLAAELVDKQNRLVGAKIALGDMGISSDARATNPIVQRALTLNDELIKTQSLRLDQEATLTALRRAVQNGQDLQQFVLTVINAVGEQVLLASLGLNPDDTGTQAALERDLVDSRAQLSMLLNHLGPENPKVVALRSKIQSVEQYLLTYRDRVRQRLASMQGNDLGNLLIQLLEQRLNQESQHEDYLRRAFDAAQAEAVALNGRMAQIEILEHDVDRIRTLQDTLLNRIASSNLKEDGADVRTTVTDSPVIARDPVSPSLINTILFCLTGGSGIGLLLVYLMDTLDDHFRTVEEMQTVLSVPVLAMIQKLKPTEALGVEALQIVAAPESTESEAFRTLRTALSLSHQEAHRIVISSAEPGDGKTTVLANLAAALAQSQKKTLLIDADLRRPGLTASLNMRGLEGLSGIVRGEAEISAMAASYIQASGIQDLDVLPSGPRPSNPAELLASPRFAELLAWAEGIYDQILIDSPPALATSDAAMIGRLVDGVILVVQPAKNRRRILVRTVETFSFLKIPVLGLVVNRMGSGNAYYYYGYDGYSYDYTTETDSSAATPLGDGASDLAALLDPQATEAELTQGVIPRRVA